MASSEKVTVRPMCEDDIASACALTSAEGWPMTQHKLRTLFSCYPEGMFVAEMDGTFVGAIGGIKFGEKYGSVLSFIVDKECRGKGIVNLLLKMVSLETVAVRPMCEDDIASVCALTSAEGWAMTQDKLRALCSCYGEGIFVAEMDGKFLGAIAGVKFGEEYGSMGVFIVDKECRGKGIGRILTRAVNDYLELSSGKRNICLNGMDHVVDLYRRQGYKVLSWQTVAYRGKCDLSKLITQDTGGIDILPLDNENFQHCIDYDKGIHPTDRSTYLQCRFSQEGARGQVAMHEGKVVGYAFLFPNEIYKNYDVGPLYADTKEAALALLKTLLTEIDDVKDKGICMDAVSTNSNQEEFAKMLGLTEHHRSKRMYTLRDIELPLEKIYALMDVQLHIV